MYDNWHLNHYITPSLNLNSASSIRPIVVNIIFKINISCCCFCFYLIWRPYRRTSSIWIFRDVIYNLDRHILEQYRRVPIVIICSFPSWFRNRLAFPLNALCSEEEDTRSILSIWVGLRDSSCPKARLVTPPTQDREGDIETMPLSRK
jgi:hypothetical protein